MMFRMERDDMAVVKQLQAVNIYIHRRNMLELDTNPVQEKLSSLSGCDCFRFVLQFQLIMALL